MKRSIQKYLKIIRCLFSVILLCLLHATVSAQISGTVFRDFNASGTRETPGEVGVGGVTITVTGANGVVNTATSSTVTASLGTYSVTPTGTAPYRVQFASLPAGYFTGPVSTGSGSTIQFVATATATNINLGVNYPADYSQANPYYLVPCYVSGDPTSATGNSGAQGVLVALPYNSTGNAPAEFAISQNSQVGTVFGLAFQRVSKHAYSAAFVKRHSGLGPGGAGAIYLTRPTNAAFTSFTSTVFTTLPMAVTVSSNSARTLPGSTTVLSQDASVFGQVGKTGLGDIELSEDGSQLYAVNLSDQKLYRIPINNPTSTNPTANTAGITSFSISGSASVCRTGSVFRPFALKGYRDKMYIGGVCTNESVPTSTTINFGAGSVAGNLYTRDTTGMKAVVYEFDPATNAFTSVLSFPLTYKKGATNNDKTGVDRATYWLPWTDVVPGSTAVPSRFARADLPNATYPQPWLTGIEFDVDGAMILSIRDRTGDQFGNNNYGPTNTTLYRVIAPGDILRAGKCSPTATQWTMESNATVCGVTSLSGVNNGQGIGNGEFYYSDAISQPNTTSPFHTEMSEGALALLMGSGEVSSIVLDPTDQIDAGGIRRFKNSDGSSSPSTSVQIYQSTDVATYGKANGLGDIELSFDPAPIEIGNRVWNDVDKDGIQDPGETSYAAVSGLTVQLLQGTTVIASTTVSATGTYLFSSATTTAIQPNTAYQVKLVIPTSTSLLVTSTASGTNSSIDSDASLAGVVSLTTGDYGENNHTYDIGVFVCTTPTGTTSFTNATCFNGVIQTPVRIAVTSIANATQANISPGSAYTLAAGFNDPTNQTVTSAAVSFSGLTGGTTYTVRLFNGATTCFQDYVVTVPAVACCGISLTNVVAGVCSTTNNQFNTTGTVRLSNVPAAGTLYVSNGAYAQTFAVTTSTTAVSFTFVAESDGVTRTISTSLASCGTASTTVASPATCFVACAASCSTVAVTRYGSTALANAQFKYIGLGTEARYGNNSLTGAYELDFYRTTPTSATLANDQYTWGNNTVNSFTLTYNPSLQGDNRTVFTLSSGTGQTASIQVNPQTPPDALPIPLQFNAIQLSVQANNLLSSTGQVAGLALNGIPLNQGLSATSTLTSTGIDNIILRSSQLNQAFTLTGTITFSWLITPPTDLAVNLRLGVVNDCVVPPVTTVNSATIACQATSTTLTATSSQTGLTYAWTGPNSFTANTQSVTVTAVGTYTVVGTNPQTGCSSTATATVTQNPSVTATVSALPGATICQGASVTLNANASGGTGFTYTWSPAGTGTSPSVIVSPTVTTTYSVTVTNATNCSAVTAATITVNPAVTVTVASQTICNGTAATLTANAVGGTGLTYAWSTGASTSAITVSPTSTTPYTVTVTNSNGCSGTATATVTVNPAVTAVITVSPGNTICQGTTTTLTASGGNAYRWSTGATTSAITVSPTNTTVYSVTVTNAATSCSAITSATITVNPAVTATVASQTICNGTAATLTVNASGGTGFTYAWSPAGTGSTQSVVVSPTTTTAYTVTVTNGNGCSAITSATVTVNPAVTATVANQVICNGTSATLTANASGGTGFTYTWSPAGTGTSQSVIVSPTVTTAYSVTVTSNTSCSTVATATVTVNPAVTATVANQTICNGLTATLSAAATGGAGFTYTWSTGANTSAITVLPTSTTTYSVTVTNSNGCSAIASATVTVNPAVTATVASRTICYGTSTALTANASGGTGFTYAWSPTGTGSTQTVTVSPLTTTTYSVTVTNGTGCSAIATATVTVNPAVTATVANQTICPGTSATLTASASGGTGFTYTWSPAGTGTSQSVVVSPTVTTTYSVTVTSNTSCSTVATATVTVNPSVTATLSSATICTGNSATLIATGGVSYRFGPGNTNTTGRLAVSPTTIGANPYSVTVTSAEGCTAVATASVLVNALPQPTIAGTATLCAGQPISLTASPTTGLTYAWSGPGGNLGSSNPLTIANSTSANSGTYQVLVTDANGCTATASYNVTVKPVPVVQIINTSITCSNNQPAVAISTQVTGGSPPISYAWYRSGAAGVISTSPNPVFSTPDTYSLIVTDASGCLSNTATVTVMTPDPLAVNTQTVNALCFNAQGRITVTTSGGMAPYTVRYFNSGGPISTTTTSGVSTLQTVAGSYTITITDANGCALTQTAAITQPPLLAVSLTSGGPVCAGQTTGTITSSVTGGTPPYSYSWSNGATTANLSNLPGGSYSVVVTDANGCVSSQTITIATNPLPNAPTVNVTQPTCVTLTGTIQVLTPASGVQYSFNNGISYQVSPTLSGLQPDVYQLRVKDNSTGCVSLPTSVTINPVPSPPVASIAGNTVYCAGVPISLTASPTTGVTYAWSGPAGSLGSANPLVVATTSTAQSGTYRVTVTDANGCTATASATITVNPAVTAVVTNQTICAGLSATLTASGGTTYRWVTGATTATIVVSPATTTPYAVTVTNASGCSAVGTGTVTVNQSITATVNSATLTCQAPTASLSVTSSQTGLTYQWTGPNGFTATTQQVSVTYPGTYTVVSTNAQTGCAATTTTTVSQLAGVEVTLFTQSSCLNNGTDATATDDYFTVTIQATNGTPGAAGRYEVVLGADANGLGGTVLNPGGTLYGSPATVGGVGQPNARGFLANNSSIYSLSIRDSNATSGNSGCRSTRLTGQVSPCSSCLPPLCQPARIQKQ
ncbi:SdrD B-like domain-containing protein [Fibrella arboris]|uniref:SdrD B-like domain-containing protein n=1 Tax=Fibrella arboris TaxID=3242486 RepID=UPI0035209BE8